MDTYNVVDERRQLLRCDSSEGLVPNAEPGDAPSPKNRDEPQCYPVPSKNY